VVFAGERLIGVRLVDMSFAPEIAPADAVTAKIGPTDWLDLLDVQAVTLQCPADEGTAREFCLEAAAPTPLAAASILRGTNESPAPCLIGERSADLQIFGRFLATVRNDVEAHLRAFLQAGVASLFHRRDVDKHVPAAAVRLNEAIALCRIEPLNCSGRHFASPFERNASIESARLLCNKKAPVPRAARHEARWPYCCSVYRLSRLACVASRCFARLPTRLS